MGTHRYVGRVVEKATQNGIADLRVEARDLRRKIPTPVATAVTNARGDFILETVDENLKDLFNGTPPVLYLQVIQGNNVLASTERTQRWAANRDGEGRVEVVSARPLVTRPASPRQTVEGIVGVRDADTLGSGLEVRVYERRLQLDGTVAETQVATATAGEDGSYRVGFDSDQDVTSKLDLVVKTYDGANLVATNSVCKAPARATVDVVPLAADGARHQGPPRYNTVKSSVTRVALEAGNDPPIALASIQSSAYGYMACRAEADESEVTALVEAAQLFQADNAVSEEVYYALLRRGMTKTSLFGHRLSVHRAMLLEAVRDRTIAPIVEDNIETIINSIETAAVTALSVAGSTESGRPFTPIGQLATITPGINTTKRDAFIKHALRNEGTSEELWAAIAADTANFTAAEVASLKFSADVASVVAFWPDLIAILHGERTASNITFAREIAKYSQAQWETFIGTSFPPDTPGANTAERRTNYAKFILGAVEARYRTAFIGYRQTTPQGLVDFFASSNNTGFDFATKRVGRYLQDNQNAMSGVTDPSGTTAKLKELERLFKVAPTWAEMQKLQAAGLTSAAAIHRLGRAGLIAAVPTIDINLVDTILDNACWLTWGAMGLHVKYSTSVHKLGLSSGILPDWGRPAETTVLNNVGLPDWATLFGTLEQCACDHCRSVLSPSAYLVDVLEFLSRVTTGSTNAKTVLTSRRPDIPRLVLSCENGSTARPYIDLVNEILEIKASVGGGAWPATDVDTQQSTAELLAHPDILYPTQHVDAYAKLAQGLHPFSMPFHLWAKEARVYLDYLGVPRHLLVEKLATGMPGAPNTRVLAIERLDLAPKLYDVFADAISPAPSWYQYWGYVAPDPGLGALGPVPNFLKRAGISYDELRELLSCEYSRSANIAFANDTCKIEDLALNTNSPNWQSWLGETQKILRLRQVLGWSITDTAKARVTFSTSWSSAVESLSALRLIQQRTGLEALEILAWYGEIDRHPISTTGQVAGYEASPSLFERLFLNKTVLNPDEAALTEIWTNGNAIGPLKDRALGLLPALRISQTDFDLLTNATVAGEQVALPVLVNGDDSPSIINDISLIFRFVSAARAARMRLADFRVLHALANILSLRVTTSSSVEGTLQLFDVAAKLAATKAPVEEVHYLTRHVASKASALEPTAEMKEKWVDEIAAGIQTILDESDKVEDASGEMLTTLLPLLFNSTDQTSIATLANNHTALTVTQRVAVITGPLAPYLEDLGDAGTQLAGTDPTPPPALTEPSDRRTYIAKRLSRFLSLSGFIKTWFASTFGVSAEVTSWLLTGTALTWQSLPAIFAFSRQPGWADGPLPTQAERDAVILRMQKASLLAKRFAWSIHDVAALYPATTTTLPAISLQGLPIQRPAPAAPTTTEQGDFAKWLRLSDLARLRELWAGGAEALYAFFAGAGSSTVEALDALVGEATGWKAADVTSLRVRFGVTTVAGYQNEQLLARMADVMPLLRRLGASADQAIVWASHTWTAPSYDLPTSLLNNSALAAADIKRVAKAKNCEDAWAEIARPLRNVLRERQRSTLVDYLIQQNATWESANDVYADLLIDVEMAPCHLTSRLVLAHSSAQLFMNRILLNLESPTLEANEEAARQWKWMKNYRVWEANRKVFLWPENWIEPELRDDKTPLFREFENRLLQGPLDATRAEDAYRAYLEGLADIANLEIVAVHEEAHGPYDFKVVAGHVVGTGAKKILHVFGKSRTANKHFYRKREDGRWGPWSKMDIDIEGNHLIPVTLGGRLYLFWPNFGTKAADVQLVPDQEVPEQLGIRFAWSELRSTGWTAPAFGPTDFIWLAGNPKLSRFALTARVTGPRVELDLLGDWQGGQRSWRIATFSFDPAGRTVEVYDLIPLAQYTSYPVPQNGEPPENRKVKVPRPSSTTPHFQFLLRDDAGPLDAYLPLLDSESKQMILGGDVGPFTVVAERKPEPVYVRNHLFFSDGYRTLFLDHKTRPIKASTNSNSFLQAAWALQNHGLDHYYRIEHFYHPYVTSFRRALALRGVDGLLRWSDQGTTLQTQTLDTSASYDPVAGNTDAFPKERVDFSIDGAYGVYNWELFFHAPLLMATRLSQEGRHDEAQRWFHYIFDPTDGSSEAAPRRYWKVKPFHLNVNLETIQEDLTAMSLGEAVESLAALTNAEVATPASDTLTTQVDLWRKDPFNPHAIARLRTVAYQKNVFIKYIENLLSWGDQLFARDTMESINEATQLYILAQELLGERPAIIHDPTPLAVKPYEDLGTVDIFGNAIAEIEAIMTPKPSGVSFGCSGGTPPPEIVWGTTYFCVPLNEKLLGLWDVVADRLFKIRHCMNIEGIVRVLPLFEPPIDPALLVQAAAAGLDISSVLNDLNVAAPPYRYSILYAKAQDIVGSVVALGSTALSVLEKQDAEALSNLRTRHEVAMNELVLEVRKAQVAEAKQNIKTLEQSLKGPTKRFDYYSSRPRLFDGERDALDSQHQAHIATQVAGGLNSAASILHAFPNQIGGFAGAFIEWGPSFLARMLEAGAEVANLVAAEFTYDAIKTEKMEEYKRRKEDWELQASLAKIEVEQIKRDLLAAQIRLQIAESELSNHETQLAQSREIETFLRTKYTNEELYGWMKGQLMGIYYQAYKLAYEMAKRAQRAFQYERGDDTQTFISFGYWDGFRQGLLAGDKLANDLRRMDAAYHAQNKRELELVKTVSLAEHDPEQLVNLRELGSATISLAEDDYDRDFLTDGATHYLRRLKSVAVTVPCITGPYQGVYGTFSVLKGAARKPTGAMDTSFGAIQSVCTSQAQADSGLFELRFQDERLLPFEGVGAHLDTGAPGPQWMFKLSGGNRFKYDSIDDLVLDVRYTARPGRVLTSAPPDRTLKRLVRVKTEFADSWQAFLEGASTIDFALPYDSWSHAYKETLTTVESATVYGWWAAGTTPTPTMALDSPASSPAYPDVALGSAAAFGTGGTRWKWTSSGTPTALPYTLTPSEQLWKLAPGSKTTLLDVWLVLTYKVSVAL